MAKSGSSGSPGWSTLLFTQTTEDVDSSTTIRSPRPSVIFSSKDDGSNSQLQKLQRHVSRVLKGFSSPPQVKRVAYNPEILTSQKRLWARSQQSLDQRLLKEPSRIFESLVVVGLPPNSDVMALQKLLVERNSDGLKGSRTVLNYQQQVQTGIEPQVLFVYPPEKQLPLKCKDLLSFCFPGGLEIHAVERSPSMSELNEILLGQEHLKQSELSFLFRLQVADDSTLYGCCVLVEEIVQKPSGLISIISEEKPFIPSLNRCVITAPRCYCILSRLPFFDLHFGVLKSIFTEERLQRLTEGIDVLNLLNVEIFYPEDDTDVSDHIEKESIPREIVEGPVRSSHRNHGTVDSLETVDKQCSINYQMDDVSLCKGDSNITITSQEILSTEVHKSERGSCQNGNGVVHLTKNKQEKQYPEAVLPLWLYHQCESSDSSTSFHGSPSEERNFRSEIEDTDPEEPSSSGREESGDHNDILEWAKANGHGSLHIICEYYQLRCPMRGSVLTFHPLEHLHPLEFQRPSETVLHSAGSTIDVRSCSTSLELAEVHNALLVEEEATALYVWTIACICGSLKLENVLILFAGALLEKQIVLVCSNLGILSASVLSVIPLIRPYQWQSLLMPILPNDMLDFLDAPVPYIVGIKNKTFEVQSRLANTILIDVNKNQVKSHSMPKLPQHKELFSSLSPYHATLVGESYLARKRPVYECTDAQVEAAKGFLAVLRSYLDSLCSNLRSHTITNVQSNDDKVSLLLKESFIDSFPSRDRPFMKLFLDTQLFSVQTDLVLSFYQRD